jgi:choline monooxygenase
MSVRRGEDAADTGVMSPLDDGSTLPYSWYSNTAIYELEQRRIFRRSWQFAGLTHYVEMPGDFFTCQAGQVPIVVTRDGASGLNAFVNVCRHRGSVLVNEPFGNQKSLQCSYHAWTYGLDGSLLAVPGSGRDFDRQPFHLLPVRVETWGPFIFVNLFLDCNPLAATLGSLPELTRQTGLPLDLIRPRLHRKYEIKANWKVVVDNYLECYHCRVAHPSFCDLIDLDNYVVTEYELFSTQTGPIRESARRKPYEVGGGVEAGFYAYLWPNFTINVYPGPGNLSLNIFEPIDVDHTLAKFDYCFVDSVADQAIEDFAAFIDQVQIEDTELCESVQRGLRSGMLDRGTLMLPQEKAVAHFQRLVAGAIDGGQ